MFHQSLVRSWPLIACRKSCRKREQEEGGGNTEEEIQVKKKRKGTLDAYFKPHDQTQQIVLNSKPETSTLATAAKALATSGKGKKQKK